MQNNLKKRGQMTTDKKIKAKTLNMTKRDAKKA